MKYDIPNKEKGDILDNNSIKQVLSIIKELVEEDFTVKIETAAKLIDFLNNPELFLDDEKTIDKIKKLRDIIVQTGDFYYV